MIINSISLYNFGSYEGNIQFKTNVRDNKNIILVGGKNGAGKTTLFTAMRLCLYGYMSMGYKSPNSYYYKAITKLINNTAKINKPTTTSVILSICLNNGQGYDNYNLCRTWVLNESINEQFSVEKNDRLLSSEEISDFEKYLLSLFPPELFNLYFFDGEKIADFFLNEGNNSRIKQAFLTLCGYDTFEIMRKNFKRIGANSANSSPALTEYITAKEATETAEQEYNEATFNLEICKENLCTIDEEISKLDKDYYSSGGITQEEWDKKVELIKEEDKKRERWNALIKKWANDIIPFVMIKDRLIDLKNKIIQENQDQKINDFLAVLNSDEIINVFSDNNELYNEILSVVYGMGSNSEALLSLSLEQSAEQLTLLNELLEFDVEQIYKCKKAIKSSIVRSTKIKQELDKSNITSAQAYMTQRMELLERKNVLLDKQIELEHTVVDLFEKLKIAESNFSKTQTKLESELKKSSISDISTRSVLMLDNLQKYLYRERISKVEDFFRTEISILMRKAHFIDDIHIDDDFTVHIYRNERVSAIDIQNVINQHSYEEIITMWGEFAANALLKLFKVSSFHEISTDRIVRQKDEYELPIEIDKMSLSNGEKQIFIMALYHSLISLSNNEIPFVIDTPFARIDTEHRHNIAKYFFSKLKGQVFILSTNEEINEEHIVLMEDKIRAKYLLNNVDNKRTTVISDVYFGDE